MTDEYKSPLKKLVVFFKDSRDSWKGKFQELKVKHRNLERRHDYTIEKMASLKGELSNLKSQLLEIEKLSKKRTTKS